MRNESRMQQKSGMKSKKKIRNKSFERDHSGNSSRHSKLNGPLSTKQALKGKIAFSPANGRSDSKNVSMERKRKTGYQSIKAQSSPINLVNEQAVTLNETPSTKTQTQNPF